VRASAEDFGGEKFAGFFTLRIENNLQHETIICSPQHMTSQGDTQSQSLTTCTCMPHSLHSSLEPLLTVLLAFLCTGFFVFLFMVKSPFQIENVIEILFPRNYTQLLGQ
jgi:hypothetical protein